jgi:Fe-S-cluster containining protein
MEQKELVRRIREIGFSCRRCGECCHSTERDANLVMVFPAEIKELTGTTGQKAEDFSQPYPENVCTSGGGSITFEWCLKRTLRGCIFLEGDRCTAYASRPWICRTYPFMLSGDSLSLSPCNGFGGELSEDEAEEIAGLLIARRDAEQEEEERVRVILSSQSIPAGKNVLVDGTGIRVL